MDVDAYRQARYRRLVEHAVALGCPEGEAPAYVERVLTEQQRRIKRADDPDPVVMAALESSLEPERPRGFRWIVVTAGAALVAAIGVVALVYDPPPKPVPSLFAYDGAQAERVLEQDGYDVRLQEARACEPQGLVLGSDPRVGDPIEHNATITVRTAVPSDFSCLGQYQDRFDAWQFVRFARGGEAPDFADTVQVVVDGDEGTPVTDPSNQDRWGDTLTMIATSAETPAPTRNGMPSLTVTDGTPPTTYCGIARPPLGGERPTLRIAIDASRDDLSADCPLTIDLYRYGRVIDTVVIYTPIP